MPKTDDRAMFEKLVLEGFQAGLSWLTILRKRENFRKAFHGFDAKRIARYGAKDIARLMADPGIVRNKLKVEATIDNARALLKLQERTGLAAFLWDFVDGRPQINTLRLLQERACRDADVQSHLQGAQGRGLSLRRADDRLCLHAGHRHGQRPPDELPSLRAVRKAAAILQGARSEVARMTDNSARGTPKPRRIARLAAHAVGPAAGPARSITRRHRNRRHRPRAGPGCALERPDGRRSRLLGGAARARRGADRCCAASPIRSRAGCSPRCCTTHPST